MNHLESTKTVAKPEASVAATATHTLEIDTLGFDHASIDVVFSAFTTTGADVTAAANFLKLQQSDASGSGQADVTGFVGGTNFTIGAGVTSASATVGYAARMDVDLRGKKRYLTVTAQPKSTVAVMTVCRLSKAEVGPTTAGEKGVTVSVSG